MSDGEEPNGGEADPSARRLVEDIRDELGQMDIVAEELEAIADDVGEGPVTLRDRAAASAFLASFYMGVENVLKRIARFHGVDPPRGERWHVELFKQFCAPEPDAPQSDTTPQSRSLPALFDGGAHPEDGRVSPFPACHPSRVRAGPGLRQNAPRHRGRPKRTGGISREGGAILGHF